MAMTAQSASSEMMAEMNTTPLIDVMLVLLVLLIITLPIQSHAVKITMPGDPPLPATPPPVVMLQVDFDGTAIWNGWRISRAELDARLTKAQHQYPQPEIHLMADRLAKYGPVAEVMADVQRHGLVKMGLVDTRPY